MMDLKVTDIERAKYWESRGYHFNPDFYTAGMMDLKVTDIERAKYWESRSYHFNPDSYTAAMMDLEVERKLTALNRFRLVFLDALRSEP